MALGVMKRKYWIPIINKFIEKHKGVLISEHYLREELERPNHRFRIPFRNIKYMLMKRLHLRGYEIYKYKHKCIWYYIYWDSLPN